MLNPVLRPLLVASLLLALVSGTAAASGGPASPTLRAVSGSAAPAIRGAARVAPAPAGQPVDVTVSLKPRHAKLLAYTASTTTASHPMSAAQLHSLFAPSAHSRAAVVSYMRSAGFSLQHSGMLTLGFRGSTAAAQHAFHVGLSTYSSARSGLFRAPDGPVQLPAGIASVVSSVSGLDTATKLHNLASRPRLTGHTVTPSCSGPGNAQASYGGYLPSDLAQAYGHGNLIQGGSNGHGESIALVELSNYKHSDIDSFKSCFGLTTPVHNHNVRGGTSSQGGAIEVELDIEVAMSNAPGLDSVEVYMGKNSLANVLPMIEQMTTNASATHTYIVSDSWGVCEDFLPPSFMVAESTELQLAAAAGISFYVASGDSGSSSCEAVSPSYTRLVADDPASQPFVTGVGGTTMHSPNGANSTAWKFGGGGISHIWPQPAYQSGNPVRTYDNGNACGNPSGFCRQVPDIALDAAPKTGYIIKCTASGCPRGVPWFPVGGTSAGAPLMAAITADSNSYSLTHGGQRLGFANPLLYSAGTANRFWDITQGRNSVNGSGLYQAAAGYDPATGLGSPQAGTLATDLAAFTAPPISQDASQLAITAPEDARTVHYGQSVTLIGTLTRSDGTTPIVNRQVDLELIEGNLIYLYVDRTDSHGVWRVKLSKGLRRNLTWQAVFPGSDTETGALASGHAIRVVPRLTAHSLPRRATRGTHFTVKGKSGPNMHGARVLLQGRRSKHSAWRTIGSVGVNRSGGYGGKLTISTPGALYLRWRYKGGKSHPWMSAISPVRHTTIT